MAAETPLRLLIAENHAILRAALGIFFSERESVELVGEAATSTETLFLHKRFQPDVLLISTDIRPMNILDLIGQLRDQSPDTRIVVLASSFNETPFENFIVVGASTVIEEGIFASNLFTVIQDVYYHS
jgi:DNA-binding NarL/FixJ family response regulator